MEAEFGGLFMKIEDAAVDAGGRLFEGLIFVVRGAAGDDRIEDAREFMRGGGDAFGFTVAFVLNEEAMEARRRGRRH